LKTINTVLAGASGYGGYYISQFAQNAVPGARLCAVVDPFASASPHFDWLKERNIPVFDSMEEFYGGGRGAELAVISSPIQFHRPQSETAVRHGTAVLCEKPLCAAEPDAAALLKASEEAGVRVGVGFQWSFSAAMEKLKRDILSGVFGKPVMLKTMVSWPKLNGYYTPDGWKGKRRGADGAEINDSVAMNAASHFLHNIFFILGDAPDTSACPSAVSARLSRVWDIQTFDTCYLRGRFQSGAEFLFCASHAAERNINPRFEYLFEKGRVTFNDDEGGAVRAVFTDGAVKDYGFPQSKESELRKLLAMTEAARTGKPPACGVRAVLPHLRVCSALLRDFEIMSVCGARAVYEENRRYARGIDSEMEAFYSNGEFSGDAPKEIML
jgi:predicted dehydrogenase